ncbi:hypothetical protein D0Y65_004588 [Glycine soja]|uniref:Peptidase A1 domain-containing protein n=1 Tax=Glycine soja TaxID=3848 RepID=A0A445LRZ1_GLYSO|nr:hypothetical protein D0Y65_004588 [Glycine soja]
MVGSHNLWPYSGAAGVAVAVAASAATKAKSTLPSVVLCRALGGRVGKSNRGWDIGFRQVHFMKDLARSYSYLEDHEMMTESLSIVEGHPEYSIESMIEALANLSQNSNSVLYSIKGAIGYSCRTYVQIDTGSDVPWVCCSSCNGCPQTSGLKMPAVPVRTTSVLTLSSMYEDGSGTLLIRLYMMHLDVFLRDL